MAQWEALSVGECEVELSFVDVRACHLDTDGVAESVAVVAAAAAETCLTLSFSPAVLLLFSTI